MANGTPKVIGTNTAVSLQIGMILMLGAALISGTRAVEGMRYRDEQILAAFNRHVVIAEERCDKNINEDHLQTWIDKARWLNAGKSFLFPDVKDIKN